MTQLQKIPQNNLSSNTAESKGQIRIGKEHLQWDEQAVLRSYRYYLPAGQKVINQMPNPKI